VSEFPQELKDAAARMRDAVNLHVLTGTYGARDRQLCWVAIRLEDGRSDGELYESRRDAVKHTTNREKGWFYAKVGADVMHEQESIIVLQQARQAFKAGVIFAEEQVATPMLSELLTPYIPNTLEKLGLLRPARRSLR
jgi:hypothetical protein